MISATWWTSRQWRCKWKFKLWDTSRGEEKRFMLSMTSIKQFALCGKITLFKSLSEYVGKSKDGSLYEKVLIDQSFLLSTTQDILAIIQQWDDLVHSNTLTPEQRMIHEQRMIQHYVAAIFDQQNLVIILFLSSPTCLWGSIFLSALWLIQASCDIYWAGSMIKKSAMVILSAMDTLCMV